MSKPAPRILIAPNAFKGCLTAADAARAIARGARRAAPKARLDLMPVSDGGDGLMEVLLAAGRGRRVVRTVAGPLGERRRARYALLGGGREAVVEMAQASGIAGLPLRRLDPLRATSRGTGELIADALARGARRVVVGMGGSATSDGGAGMAQALGARLSDADGRELPPGAEPLLRLASVDASAVARPRSVIAVSDVRNPLLGRHGSARVYGPQKGATPAMVRVLERALGRYARVLARDLKRNVARLPGAGAAGGLGAGLSVFLGARLVPGADWVLARLGAARRVAAADLVLTGEGRLDAQSFFGKAPIALARLARRKGRPVRFLCGRLEPAAVRGLAPWGGRRAVYPLSRPEEDPRRAMRQCAARLERRAADAVRDAAKAGLIAAALSLAPSTASAEPAARPSSAAASGYFDEADRLYWNRNLPGNLEKAVGLLEARLRRGEDAGAWWRLGRCRVRLGERFKEKAERLKRFQDAEKALERALALDSSSSEAHAWLAIAYGRRGETLGMMHAMFLVSSIRREIETALKLDPGNAAARVVIAEMLRQLPRLAGGSKKQALEHLEKAYAAKPNLTMVHPKLAEAYLDAGRKEDARRVLEAALAVKEPDDPAEYAEDLEDARRMLASLNK